MKIFRLLAILGVTIVVSGKKMKNKGKSVKGSVTIRKPKHNEGCPQEKPVVNGPCETFKDEGNCQKCHYGKHCCCDDKCTHDETYTCENSTWILTAGKCTSQCTECRPYGKDSKVCNTNGEVKNLCHALHHDNWLVSVENVDENDRKGVCDKIASLGAEKVEGICEACKKKVSIMGNEMTEMSGNMVEMASEMEQMKSKMKAMKMELMKIKKAMKSKKPKERKGKAP